MDDLVRWRDHTGSSKIYVWEVICATKVHDPIVFIISAVDKVTVETIIKLCHPQYTVTVIRKLESIDYAQIAHNGISYFSDFPPAYEENAKVPD